MLAALLKMSASMTDFTRFFIKSTKYAFDFFITLYPPSIFHYSTCSAIIILQFFKKNKRIINTCKKTLKYALNMVEFAHMKRGVFCAIIYCRKKYLYRCPKGCRKVNADKTLTHIVLTI